MADVYAGSHVLDATAPSVVNRSPDDGDVGVARDTSVVMDVIDNPGGTGVDLATVDVVIAGQQALSGGVGQAGFSVSTSPLTGGYNFVIDRDSGDFDLFQLVSVSVDAEDDVGNAVNVVYSFRVTEGDIVSPRLTAVAGDGRVQLLWSVDGEVMIDTWQLVRSTAGFPVDVSQGSVIFQSQSATSHLDTAVVNGVRYYYSIFLIRRLEGQDPVYAPYSEVSSDDAVPASVTVSETVLTEYVPIAGEFGATRNPFPGARILSSWGAVAGQQHDVYTMPRGRAILAPFAGTISSTSPGRVDIDTIAAGGIRMSLSGQGLSAVRPVGERLSPGELMARSGGGQVTMALFKLPLGSLGLRTIRPLYFYASNRASR